MPDTIAELTEVQIVKQTDLVNTSKASKQKRAATTTSTSTKPAAKKATSRNQPSSATPVTTRARAKTIKPPHLNTALGDDNNQTTMSQFKPFAALAHRHTSAIEQRQSKEGEGQRPIAAKATKKKKV